MTEQNHRCTECEIRYAGFTLVELLIVISIMAIMIAIALPRFEDIGRGSKMRAAVNELRSTVALTRQWAIANNEEVFLVYPDDHMQKYSDSGTNQYYKALRSYAVYSRSKGYIKDWVYLPAGVYFYEENASLQGTRPNMPPCYKDTKNAFRSLDVYYAPDQIPFPYSESTGKDITALRFTPAGRPLEAKGGGYTVTDFDFYLVEGVAVAAGAGKSIKIAWKANPAVWAIRVNPLTGVVKTIDCAQTSN
ncbi:MAG: prepilin-type N-terminal cleavage/methylation domain-containing protein [Kiritimatiellae bacterium]|nr:prepilin-type N-terminal cleavage/methylation domain-containing protein [Kiritimatiellia bacterium]